MSQLSHGPTTDKSFNPPDLTGPSSANKEERCQSWSAGPASSSSSLYNTPNQWTLPQISVGEGACQDQYSASKAEYEGESSLFAHAIFASRFLQNAIDSTSNAEVANEMEAVLDNLRAAVHFGKQPADALDRLYSHAKVIAPGTTTRNLPLPPIEKVFLCLRMARECAQVSTLWLGDFMRPAQFSDYFIKVASPGTATEADLIIVHCGLYWLFCECSKVVIDEEIKKDYDAQAVMCQDNLETVLANLRFHQPTNIDFGYAMGMAVSTLSNFLSLFPSFVLLFGLMNPHMRETDY